MMFRETRASLKTHTGESAKFTTNKGIKQGDSLSATLFNLILSRVRNEENKKLS